jgi:SAM-dependent methyltransferase
MKFVTCRQSKRFIPKCSKSFANDFFEFVNYKEGPKELSCLSFAYYYHTIERGDYMEQDKTTYQQIVTDLLQSYNSKATERDSYTIEPWKIEEREQFLSFLIQENKQTLLEIGSGPGRDGLYFHEKGLNVVCTDLSPEMVRLCQAKGLTAYVRDFLTLDFPPDSFDSVYALNCLLHVPKAKIDNVLQIIARLLTPSGLFYMGVYGGKDHEGLFEEDTYRPKRFFSFHTDDQIKVLTERYFSIVYFKTDTLEPEKDVHFQSMILRRAKK